MTDKHKPDIQDSGTANKSEPAAQNAVPGEDKTLLRFDALADEPIDEPTHRFVASVDEKAQTAIQNAPDTEPTKILSDDKSGEDETVATAKRYGWRFALGCAVFVVMFIYTGTNIRQAFLYDWVLPFERVVPQSDGTVRITNINPNFQVYGDSRFQGKFQQNDELLEFNGQRVTDTNQFNHLRTEVKAGMRYTMTVRSDGAEAREIEIVAEPLPAATFARQILITVLLPLLFILIGLLIFLFGPDDKRAFMWAMGSALPPLLPPGINVMEGLPAWLVAVRVLAHIISSVGCVLWLHFFLVFPERSNVLRRFPALEYLIYLPFLLIILPNRLIWSLANAGYNLLLPPSFGIPLYFVTLILVNLYFLAGVAMLWLNYRQVEEISRRKLRVMLFGLAVGILPTGILGLLSTVTFGSIFRGNFGDWFFTAVFSLTLIIPPIFAYAIVRHKVIPVSFVIRRGLQYLLAKNALRLLLVLPVAGIVWNIAANPNRTLSEILFQNSSAFYFFVALAVVDGLLMRSRLSVWIDKKFFREQYNQEKVLRELIDDVKESDSMSKLSRLVSRRIQSAIHPQSVHLFYEDTRDDGSFGTGYAMSDAGTRRHGDAETNSKSEIPNPKSQIERLAADSPILRFMQTRRGAVDFPFSGDADLPAREISWLRSIGANLLVPMHGTDGKLAGFFVLGEKLSEIPYTSRDKELLETLANQIALVQENLNLKTRVLREQRIKTEVLSRFDEGNINLLKECPKCGKCFDRAASMCDADASELTFSLPVERTIENRYRLERLLGKGGMGAVYEATDTRINRKVAVKILSGAMFGNRDALRRFEREAQTAGSLSHPNIVTVHDYGVLSTEGAFLVMELVKGESLRQILDRAKRLDRPTTVKWFGQILDGVESAHEQGIVHRDLKPDNIFVSRDEKGADRLSILDFGLARLTESAVSAPAAAVNVTVPGMIMGTLGYMPPEQLRGERTDERSDLFAAGVMIYEALHGERPYAGKSYQEIMKSMSEEITFGKDEPSVAFFKRSLALKPEKRFASASEMKTGLLKIIKE